MSVRYSHGSGYAIGVPSFDIVEAGAGGGSIARVEEGVLRVGPTSAGANPGPAAYCKGGTQPTVTDAHIVLGFINPTLIAGGALRVSRSAAVEAIETHLSPDLGLETRDIAHGIREVANAAMLRSIRAVTSEKGRDPRQYAMIAFGGSGPVHAAALADMAGITTVYVPPLPGLFSAVGLLLADMRYDYLRTLTASLGNAQVGRDVLAAFDDLVEKARVDSCADGAHKDELFMEYLVDVRYRGQSYDTTIDVTRQLDSTKLGDVIASKFHSEHERRFGYRRDDEPIILTAVRLRAWGTARAASLRDIGRSCLESSDPAAEASRTVYFGPKHGETEARVMHRLQLASAPCVGPVIIEEPSSTVVVPPGWRASVDDHGNVVLDRISASDMTTH